MNNADARRNNAEAVKCLSSPLKKAVSLVIPLELHLHVPLICGFAAGIIDLNRVIDNKIDRNERLYHARIFAHPLHRAAHRRKIHKQRHASKILKNDAGNDERYLFRTLRLRLPARKCPHMHLAHLLTSVKIAQHRFEYNADRDRKTRDVAEALFLKLRQ